MKDEPIFNSKKLLMHGIVNSSIDLLSAQSRLSQLVDRESIDNSSKIDRFDFESLENPNAVLWTEIKRFAPYHLINLDFCGKIFANNTMSALYKLLFFQFEALCEKPWLFCVTTKIDVLNNDLQLLDRLDDCLHGINQEDLNSLNIEKHFSEVFKSIVEKVKLNSHINNFKIFSEIYILGFVLWIMIFSIQKKVSFKLVSSAKYRVAQSSDEYPDMYSLVFRFNRKIDIQPDTSGIVLIETDDLTNNNFSDSRIKTIKKLSESKDLDNHLVSNLQILRTFVDQTKELLSSCGWDVSQYEAFMAPELLS
jgi:hypothetical protein